MQIKTSKLTGAALDWAVAKADEERDVLFCQRQYGRLLVRVPCIHGGRVAEWPYAPSTNWVQGGPIIEREFITLVNADGDDVWSAYPIADDPVAHRKSGPTPLIAAMRCYVAIKFGDSIEIPDQLL
jgi:hypothetical protein